MATRILFHLLQERRIHSLGKSEKTGPSQGQQGFSLVVVIFIVLTLLLASLAALQRSGNGFLGAFFNTESKEARETAESGITEIIGTLNQRDNRGLLVSGASPSTWGTTNNPVLQNPCNNKVDPTPTAVSIGATGTKAAGGQTNQRYYLKSISFTSIDSSTGARRTRSFSRATSSTAVFDSSDSPSSPVFNPDDISLTGDRKGYLTLVVVGEVLRPGTNTVVSTAEVRREFQIVPKCCDRSFGNTYANPQSPSPDHGLDLRPCPASSAFTPLIVGTRGDGTFTKPSANSYSLTSGGSPLQTIATLNSSEDCSPVTDCQYTWSRGGTTNTTLLKPINLELPPLPPPPSAVNKSGCINSNLTLPYSGLSASSSYAKPGFPLTGNCTSSTVSTPQTVYQNVGRSSGGNPRTCPAGQILESALPSNAITVDSNGNNEDRINNRCYLQTTRNVATTTPDPYCAYNGSTSRFQCLVRYINGNIAVTVDTTEAPVDIYLYDAAGSSSLPGGTVSFNGNGGFSHVKCTTYSASCTTNALLVDSNRFTMYGNITNQDIDLVGNTSSLAGFFYLPLGNVVLKGGGSRLDFSGILWTNNLSTSGSVAFDFPSTGEMASNICALYPNLCDSDPANDIIRPLYDFVARSVSSTSLYN